MIPVDLDHVLLCSKHESALRYLGCLNDFPDHWTQGEDFEDLKENLKDLYKLFNEEEVPGIRKVEEFEVA